MLQNPKSKIRNPKFKIQNPKFAQKELLHNAPKSESQNPKSKTQNPKSKTGQKSLDFGRNRILDGSGNVPLGNSVTVPRGQRLKSPVVHLDSLPGHPSFYQHWAKIVGQTWVGRVWGFSTVNFSGVLNFFLWLVILTARILQKPTPEWEAKNETTARTFQKPTPEWEAKNRKKNVAFQVFLWVELRSQKVQKHKRKKNTTWHSNLFSVGCSSWLGPPKNPHLHERQKMWEAKKQENHGSSPQPEPSSSSLRLNGTQIKKAQPEPFRHLYLTERQKEETMWRLKFFL